MGDGFIQDGVMVWGPHTAVATSRAIALWDGLRVKGRKLVPRDGVLYTVPWSDVTSYWRCEREFPASVGWEPCEVVTFDVPTPSGGRCWLVVRKNPNAFAAAADEARIDVGSTG